MDNLNTFCNIIRKRSAENKKSIKLLYENQLYGNAISILRQELDSMIRVLYLLSRNQHVREQLIEQTINYEKWHEGKSKISDYEMINNANNLHGWARNVYEFGCSFIHLSVFHYYLEQDPFSYLLKDDLSTIKNFMVKYQEFPDSQKINMQTMIPYLPQVFDKINDNLKCHIETLEKNPNDMYVM